MAIFRVIGLIIALVTLKVLLPDVFHTGEGIVMTLLGLVGKALSIAVVGLDNVASVGSVIK